MLGLGQALPSLAVARIVASGIVSLAGVSLCAAALAQTNTSEPELEEVVVTGEKIDRSLQETATSVAVVTAKQIGQQNILRLQDIYDRTANVSETYGSAGFTIRGIANNGVSGAGSAPLATVYLDGAALPSSILYGAPTDMWDISQVEILRGPQSTLQGLNTLAGAVIMRTTDPGDTWNGRARVHATDEDDYIYSLAVGGPLNDDFGVRLATEYRDFDGFIRNVTRGEPENPLESLNVRGVLTWQPSGLPDLEARLSYTHFERDGGYSFMYTDTRVPNFFDRRTNSSDAPNTGDIDMDIVNLELNYALSDTLRLNSTTSFNTADEQTSYDGDFTAASLGFGGQGRDYDTLSEELRLTYDSERLSGLLGAFYYQRDQVFRNNSLTNVPTPVGTIAALLQGSGFDTATANAVAGLYGAALPVIPVDYGSRGTTDVETYALFGDGRWHMTDRLALLAGFRWDHEVNTTKSVSTSEFVGTYPNPNNYGAPGSPLWLAIAGINQAVGGLVAQAGAETPSSRRDFDAFLPKLGVSYELASDVSAAFVVQCGYRSGGSSENIARASVTPYDPEYTWNYELSLRSQWLDQRLTLNANAFYVDWSDQQVAVNFGLNNFDSHTVNAGSSHLYGFEIELTHRITNAVDWYASLGHVRTQFDDFKVALGSVDDLSGLEFAYAPKWTLGAGVNLRWRHGITGNLNANYRSEVITDVGADQNLYRVGSRTVVNARVGRDGDHWGVHLIANNLFDEEYIQYDALTLGMAVLGAPRVFGVMIETKF
jgi:iron complex outermembrane recepter protein